jgi:hypothetical protein
LIEQGGLIANVKNYAGKCKSLSISVSCLAFWFDVAVCAVIGDAGEYGYWHAWERGGRLKTQAYQEKGGTSM